MGAKREEEVAVYEPYKIPPRESMQGPLQFTQKTSTPEARTDFSHFNFSHLFVIVVLKVAEMV